MGAVHEGMKLNYAYVFVFLLFLSFFLLWVAKLV